MITGSCLCGQIRYELNSPPQLINNCYCSICQKAHGAAFGSFLHADVSGFKWKSGENLITTYSSSQENSRNFCSVCGSNVPVPEIEENSVVIPAGTLDCDPGIKPVVHIFTGSKPSWYDISDSLPKFDEFPSEQWYTEVLNSQKKEIPGEK
ncbi:GFA family protein [Candidatus Uabimicrobium sp. HlEnr_7]|uniref:GFA family protein n=1 Tax=Candidatus Uabimicrobium helgolandensis TaxID=3095367 RepID=UPI003558A1A2